MTVEFFGTFIGNSSFVKGFFRIDDDNMLYVSVPRKIPFLKPKWKPCFKHAKFLDKEFIELPLVNPDIGMTDIRTRMYFYDFNTHEPYIPDNNEQMIKVMRHNESKNKQFDDLQNKYNNERQKNTMQSHDDLLKGRMKTEIDYYKGLYPNFAKKDEDGDKK